MGDRIDMVRECRDTSAAGVVAAPAGGREPHVGLCGRDGRVPRVLHPQLDLPLFRGRLRELGRVDRWPRADAFVRRFLLLLCEEQVVRQQANPARRDLNVAVVCCCCCRCCCCCCGCCCCCFVVVVVVVDVVVGVVVVVVVG